MGLIKKLFYLVLVLISIILISCSPKEVPVISFNETGDIELAVGTSIEIAYTVSDESNVELSSSNNDICYFDGNTLVAIASGEAQITIKSQTSEATAIIKKVIVYNTLSELEISGDNELTINSTMQLTAIYDSSCRVDLKWSSNDTSIATVKDGLVTAIKVGTVKIIIEDLISDIKYEKVIKITDYPVITKISITSNDSNKLLIGEMQQLNVSHEDLLVSLTWKSTDEKVLTVDSNGLVTAIGLGKANIIVTDIRSKLSASRTMEVIKNDEELVKDILAWALNNVGSEGVDYVDLPTTHPTYGGTISWSSSDEILLDTSCGLTDIIDYDSKLDLTCKVILNDEMAEQTIDFTVTSYPLYDISEKFIKQFKAGMIFTDMNLITEFTKYGGASITWTSSNVEIFSNLGKFVKPFDDTAIIITYTVKITELNLEKTYTKEIIAEGMNIDQKALRVKEWLVNEYVENNTLTRETYLIDYIEEFDCYVEWYNTNGAPLKLDLTVGNPVLDDGGIYVVIKINIGGKTSEATVYFKTNAYECNDKWEIIKLFTDTIATTKLQTYTYMLYLWSDVEPGYIPFTNNDLANVEVNILDYTYGRVRTGITKTSTEYIVIHDTGNANKGANGKAHANLLINYNNNPDNQYISWHYSIDDEKAYQSLPLDEVAYHAGDGSLVFGETWENAGYVCLGGGNRNGIGIETCIDEGSDYTETLRITAKVVAELLINYNLGFDRIKQHFNFSGKNCPQVMRGSNRWDEFIYLVKLEYFAKTQLKDVKIEWKSLSSELNDHGQMISSQEIGKVVSYQVSVTYNGETRIFTYSSTLEKR